MLFRRREKEPLTARLRNLVWPSMSFRRVFDYYKYRSIRIQASEHAIAAGLAFGCLVSWTPTFGTHLLQCLLFCWATRTSFIASVIGSGFGNFVTTPLLMLISYHAGRIILDVLGFDAHLLHNADDITEVTEAALGLKQIFLPTLVGGYVVGILTFPLYYYPTRSLVRTVRAARRARIQRKAQKEVIEMTGEQL
ncbi:MAG: DUF2062 domain-containing protein [Micavibrio sp.]